MLFRSTTPHVHPSPEAPPHNKMSSRLRSALDSLGILEEERPTAFLRLCVEIEKEMANLPIHACNYCKTTFNKRKEKLQHIQDSHQDVLQSFLVTVKVSVKVLSVITLTLLKYLIFFFFANIENRNAMRITIRESRGFGTLG